MVKLRFHGYKVETQFMEWHFVKCHPYETTRDPLQGNYFSPSRKQFDGPGRDLEWDRKSVVEAGAQEGPHATVIDQHQFLQANGTI